VDNYDPEKFWTRFQTFSDKDLPVIIKTGIKQSTLSVWRTRKIYPRADDAVRIAETLGTSVEYLVTGSDKALSPLDPVALEIAFTANKLPQESQNIALTIVKALLNLHLNPA
jgi:transcriptional regulator with XRE-family HTH domain